MIFFLEILQNSLRTQSENRCCRCFLRTDLQTCLHGFSDLWAARFSENIWDIFSSSCAVQKEVHFEHIVEKIFPSLFRKKILFLFNFGEIFYLEKECFSPILLFLRIILRDIVKFYLKIFILIFLRKRKKLFYK